ncbi:MAG: rod shape-determining protein MreD [Lachnospiraceae bacterium]|nr:rod shape-determining protein MreD [Lachnospiraceae bacterium]
MYIFVTTLLLLIILLLQTTIFATVNIGGIIPNLIIILISSIGFSRGRKMGLIFGFLAGLILDIFYGPLIGLYAIAFMYIGFLNGYVKRVLFTGDFALPIGIILLSDFVYCNFIYVCLYLLQGDFNYLFYFTHKIIPELISTGIAAILLYPMFNLIFTKLEKVYADE